ncbi:hypothetical protein [Dictyobacter aurantiacus]|uniref:Uncharacterized protein n=1 Tax=Dictyobacter aurantiacus TaxID=1936993 RepID=A0A401ZEU8_9CHLR|nr:hypothetical protein [Dictyobacter aurantiacus]GCE05376.1 hypothetical protein KDAU_27050 [Dictyobacter aurantiacus]
MREFLKRKKIMLAGVAGAILMLAVLAGALFISPMFASAASNPATSTPAATQKGNGYCALFNQNLAKRLNISVSALQQDRKGAASDTIDQLVKEGKMKQTQADKLKQRIARSKGNACMKLPVTQKARLAALLKKYSQDADQQLAQGLHLTTSQLTTQLKSGKKLVDIARAQNVSSANLQTLANNIVSSELKKAVSAKDLTQKRADAITTALKKHPQIEEHLLAALAKKAQA